MPAPQPELSDAQTRAAGHGGGPLLILGGAGSGKTETLLARVQWLLEQGQGPEGVLVLCASPATADHTRARLEDGLRASYEQLHVHAPAELCALLLRDEALEAGLDPFFVTASQADRVALLLERQDELSLARHDMGGRPPALMATLVRRIDHLKDELVDAQAYRAWAAELERAALAEAPSSRQASLERAQREREFARVWSDHDRMLLDRGALDAGELVAQTCALLGARADVRARVAERFAHVLVDDLQDCSLAAVTLTELLTREHHNLLAAADEDQAVWRHRGAADKNASDFTRRYPRAPVIRLAHSLRCPERVLRAAGAVVAANHHASAPGGALSADAGGEVSFWRCANARSQAQSVAADVERLIAREGVAPARIAVLMRSLGAESVPVAGALSERAVPHRLVGAAAFYERAEVRDLLAWLRLLVDPRDAGAVVRALARPPVELRSVDLARVIQIARRRKLDMVSALGAAIESPQVPPEARERLQAFLRLHRAAAAALDSERPDVFIHRLIERLGLRRQQLFAAQSDVVHRLVNLARVGEIAAAYVRRAPQATPRELAGYLAAVSESGLGEEEAVAQQRADTVTVMTLEAARGREFDHVYVLGLQSARMPGARRQATEPIPDALLGEALPADSRAAHVAEMRRLLYVGMTRARERLVLSYAEYSERGAVQPPSPFAEDARAAVDAQWQEREEELFGPAETLHSTLRMMREEVLDSVARVGGRLGELRLDTDLDISHGVARFLELIKLAALVARPPEQSVADALGDLNPRVLAAATSLQREILQTSALDEVLVAAEHDERRRAQVLAKRHEPSLEAFLPRRGDGLVLSASDIETYRTCPLKYKFARVFRIPSEPTLNQRFGILIHQVLERYHAQEGRQLAELGTLLEAGWRRGGFGDSVQERQLHDKARTALGTYHDRLRDEPAQPVWFERSFAFRMGPHHLRGRVDRVDRLPGGGHELIDYKTGRPKTATQLKDDVQLSLYAVGAQEAWQLEAAQQAYYYVLDNEKVPVPRAEADAATVTELVLEVADGILGQDFEPTPSYAACSMCDYRIVCPAAET